MTHLLTRLREWVIRKLGGYTAPQDLQIYTIHHVLPVRLTSVQTVSYRDCKQARVYHYAVENAENLIAADIVKTMLRNGQIAFSAHRLPNGDTKIQGTVLLYPLDGLEVR